MKNKNNSGRRVDRLAEASGRHIGNSINLVRKTKIKTWKMIVLAMFGVGITLALIGSVALNIQTDSEASTGVQPLAESSFPAPTNLRATVASPTQINLTWTPSYNGIPRDYHEIYRCQGVSCTNFVRIHRTFMVSEDEAYNNTGLTALTTYRYKIRTYYADRDSIDIGQEGYSVFTSTVSATTLPPLIPPPSDITPPAKPTLLAPPNGSETTDRTPTFKWNPVTDPSGVTYHIGVDNNNDFSSREINIANLAAPAYTRGAALAPGKYYWRVRAIDGDGNVGAWSLIRNVTVR